MKIIPRNFKIIYLLLTLLFYMVNVNAQSRNITGIVTGEGNESLPGVNVIVKGTTNGTITDLNGNYSIEVRTNDSILVFTYVGYLAEEINVKNQTTRDVSLVPDFLKISEVVVVGYGSQKKSDITGSVASLPKDRLEMVPNINVTQAIQGAIPGVSIIQNSAGAAPDNEASSILIRGRNSILAENDPLIIVDGIPYGGQLRDISPNDIESIEVLKDASSAAIYGSRGANGVILISTKRGTSNKAVFSYDGYYSIQQFANLPDLMNGDEFYDFKWERESFSRESDTLIAREVAFRDAELAVYDSGAAVYWPKEVMRSGYSHQHNLSVVGGSEKVKYFIAANILDVTGIAKNDNYNRISTRVNLDADIKDWLTIGTSTVLTYDDRSGSSPSFSDAFWMNPLTKAYNEDGTLTVYPWEGDNAFSNPLAPTLYTNTNTSFQALSNNYVKIDIPFIEGLNYRANLGVRKRFRDIGTYRGRDTKVGLEALGSSDVQRWNYSNFTLENIINYNREFEKHSIGLTGVYSYESDDRSGHRLVASGYPNDVLGWYGAAQAQTIEPNYVTDQDGNNMYYEKDLISQMLRANYGYDSRYLLTFTIRRDGYSGFGNDTKWGTFPSVALGWNIANESFFNSNTVDVLKLRASWGKNGNQAVGAYETIAKLEAFDYVTINGETAPGYIPDQLGIDNLSWETTTSINLGIDYGILRGRFTGDLNVYNSNTTDLLLNRSIPAMHGSREITQNIGEVNNKGVEFSINSNNISRSNFKWSTNFNLAYTQNKIVALYGITDSTGKEVDDEDNKWFIGQPINVNYDYQFDGVWQLDEADLAALYGSQPGYVKLLDVNGDTVINEDDRTLQGQTDPKFIWGMTNTFKYKQVTLSFFIQGVHGLMKENDLWNVDVWTETRRNTVKRDWWTEENPTNDIYMNKVGADRQNGHTAPRFENASFVRLRDLTLAYDLSPKVLSKMNLSKFRVYVTGRNLLTLTNWTGLDPELNSQRSTPMAKEYVIGLNIGF
jgi:TonB-linked SusC/RagA family outer membrane protein